MHADSSKIQLGSNITQDEKPIAFYSRKLSPAQTQYTTTAICGFLRSVEKTNKNSFLLMTQNFDSGFTFSAWYALERKLRLKINALTNLMFNIHESISSLRFTKLFQ